MFYSRRTDTLSLSFLELVFFLFDVKFNNSLRLNKLGLLRQKKISYKLMQFDNPQVHSWVTPPVFCSKVKFCKLYT